MRLLPPSHLYQIFIGVLLAASFSVAYAEIDSDRPAPDPTTGLLRYDGCIYEEASWNDGDSFSTRLPTGERVTARLYRVDSIESVVSDTTAARRLRAQRRYFGISDFGGSPQASIQKAVELGKEAADFTRAQLAEPFTVWTSHADARGGGNRIYVFIETAAGHSLGDRLVQAGLARAFGVYRKTPFGTSQDESRERMKDLELGAAARGRGIWAFTDWEKLPDERSAERLEIEELRLAVGGGAVVDEENPVAINTADAATLQNLPGVGPSLAARIIAEREKRPFRDAADLSRVRGIGSKTIASLESLVDLESPDGGLSEMGKN